MCSGGVYDELAGAQHIRLGEAEHEAGERVVRYGEDEQFAGCGDLVGWADRGPRQQGGDAVERGGGDPGRGDDAVPGRGEGGPEYGADAARADDAHGVAHV